MCSPQHSELIQEVVDEYVNDDRAFTAFEVSLEVKKRADKAGLPKERHRHMRGVIHQCLQSFVNNGVYQQTLVDVGAPNRAYLYHPPTYDPSNYVPLSRNDQPQNGSNAIINSGDVTDDDDGSVGLAAASIVSATRATKSIGKIGDARGTVAVSATLLKKAGYTPGDTVHVFFGNYQGQKAIILGRAVPNGFSRETSYTVDHGNNVRVTAHTLSKAGLQSPDGYDFDQDGDKIVITAHGLVN